MKLANIGIVTLALGGCGPAFVSDQGQLEFRGDVVDWGDGTVPNPVLVGTTVCPAITCHGEDCPQEPGIVDCFDQAATGAISLDANQCLSFDAPGAGEWTFTPKDCPIVGYAPVADSVAFTAIDPADVHGTVVQIEQLALDVGAIPGPDAAFPADWVNPAGSAYRVVEGGQFVLTPRLLDGDDGAVGWRVDQADVHLSGTRATAALDTDGHITVTARDGAAATAFLVVDGHDIPVAEVTGAGARAPASLQIVAVYYPDPDTALTAPLGARAMVRDANGNVLYGTPVQWTLTDGRALIKDGIDAGLPGPDYLSIEDACDVGRTGDGHAQLTATYRGLTDTIDLTWTQPAPTDPAPAECAGPQVIGGSGGCGCTTAGPPSGGLGIALIGLALARRRRLTARR